MEVCVLFFFFSSRRLHTRSLCDWSSDVCSSDLTNKGFNKNLILHGYLAYGFGDQVWHWEGDALYIFKRNQRMSLYGMFRQDLDYGQQYYDEITSDNIFAIAVRKPGIPIKFINLTEQEIQWFN